MPQRGRPPQPGTVEEKAALRREKVRLYVKAHRERKKNATSQSTLSETCSEPRSSSSPSSSAVSTKIERDQDDLYKSELSRSSSVSEEAVERKVIKSQPDQSVVSRATTILLPNPPLTIVRPQVGKEFALALMGTFRGQFLPPSVCVPGRQEFGSELVTPCSVWITNAYQIALKQDSGALKSTVLAIGLALTGAQYQDERLKLASLDVYRKALRQVRTDLKPLETGETTNYFIPYLSCLTAAMFEMIHDGVSANIAKHVTGAISLMEYLPRDTSINRLLSDLLLEDLSMWEIVSALKQRYPSRLHNLRKQKGIRLYKVAGDTDCSSHNATILGDLLDAADEIPAIMCRVDELRATSHFEHCELEVTEYEMEMRRLSHIIHDLEQWAVRFHKRFGPIYVQIDQSTSGTDPSAPTFQFVSYEVAAAWVYCLTFLICGIETNIEALTEVLHRSRRSSTAVVEGTPMSRSTSRIMSQLPHTADHELFLGNNASSSKTPVLHANHDPLSYRMHDLRAKLRANTVQLIEAMSIFVPTPKGIIGQSLVLFPLDRCRYMLKRELARLQNDLDNMKTNAIEDDTEILQNMERLSQAMTVYESLEQSLAQSGMSPMPED